jgi:hypothetical protein
VALRPHSRERRRGITAHNSISYSVYRRIITGWFLRTSVNQQYIYPLFHCRVDCKFAKENFKKLPQYAQLPFAFKSGLSSYVNRCKDNNGSNTRLHGACLGASTQVLELPVLLARGLTCQTEQNYAPSCMLANGCNMPRDLWWELGQKAITHTHK